MRFLDYIRSAFKNLSRQKSRTFLTVSAITVGSLSVILMVSLLTGIRTSLMDLLISMDAFSLVTVTPDPDALEGGGGGLITSGNGGPLSSDAKKLDDAALATLRALPNVVDATPIGSGIWMEAMRLENETKKMWPSLIAYEPETKVFQMPIQTGRKLTSLDMDKIVVGSRFLKTYGYTDHPQDILGKKVVFIMKMGGSAPDWGELPEKPPTNADKEWWDAQNDKERLITAEIIGVAENSAFDDNQNYINIAWAQRLMTQVRWEWDDSARKACEEQSQRERRPVDCASQNTLTLMKDDQYTKNGYGSIILKADNPDNLKTISAAVAAKGYGVSTAEDMVEEMNKVFLGIGTVLGIIGGIALFVAAIGIINTMVMATYERIREIGVMRACGATRATIRHLFTFEAAMLGFWGGVFGLLLSILIGKIGTKIVDRYATDIPIPIDQIAQFPWWLVTGVLAFTTLIGVLSGLYPAVRAARLNPVDALRYE
ncbi:MAG: ABC transporter permease [Candidatus Kerfeldbacteria bacterium]|nr:ABC transporter permease [Candidatus Kerfeldbacteria bacterium]